jgi:hypothetical protein
VKASPASPESLISSSLVRKVSVVFASVVDPVITGGLLSGGLHAVTGKCRVAHCVLFFWGVLLTNLSLYAGVCRS